MRGDHSETLPPAVVLTGPTAAGKTAAAFALADRFDVALISVDSAQVYRGLDIGSAKPDRATLARYPHALIDIRDPEQPYSAAEFAADARVVLRAAWKEGRLPVLVGGTALYLKALRYGLDRLPAADPGVRGQIEAEATELGWPALHARLAALDPDSGRRIRPADPQRIQRALELHALTGRRPSELMGGRGPDRLAGALHLVLCPGDRHLLHERIHRRTGMMLGAGLVAETRTLIQRPGLDADAPAMRAVGYRQAWRHLEGAIAADELPARIDAATRQLAKRQLTALRQWAGGLWYDPGRRDTINRIFRRVETFSARTHSVDSDS